MGERLAIAVAAVGIAVVVGLQVKKRFSPSAAEPAAESAADATQLVAGQPGAIRLAPGVAERLGVQTTEVQTADKPIAVELSGTLSLDADRLSHVHARFAGEVVEIGKAEGGSRSLDFGTSVHKGQLLAVIWSRELGEKKSELVDALSQLRLDEDNLNHLTKASVEGAVSERASRERNAKWNPTALPWDEPCAPFSRGAFRPTKSTHFGPRPNLSGMMPSRSRKSACTAGRDRRSGRRWTA